MEKHDCRQNVAEWEELPSLKRKTKSTFLSISEHVFVYIFPGAIINLISML